MSQRAGSRARGFLSRGALLSLLLHVHLLAPIGLAAWIYGGRAEREREAQKAQEVDVEFKDVTAAELPKDLPPIEPSPDQLEPPKPPQRAERRKAEKKQAAKPPTPEEKVAEKTEKPKPEQEVVVPPMPPMPKPEPKAHQKVVDLDNEKEVEPPPDAKYLAEKNNRADVETRATDTNLQKAQKGEGAVYRSRVGGGRKANDPLMKLLLRLRAGSTLERIGYT